MRRYKGYTSETSAVGRRSGTGGGVTGWILNIVPPTWRSHLYPGLAVEETDLAITCRVCSGRGGAAVNIETVLQTARRFISDHRGFWTELAPPISSVLDRPWQV